MAKYSKYNIIYFLQKWMDSVSGQTFMNYAYSWGAAVVILGTLFKLTHLAGADIMLFIGMGTEVFVFFIAAFDRPFDKTADGRALATDTELAAELEKAGKEEGNQEAGTEQPVFGTIILGNERAYGAAPEAYTASGNQQIAGNATKGDNYAQDTENVTGTESIGTAVKGVGAPAPAVSAETAIAMEEATTTYVDRLNELNELLLKVGAQSERLTTDSQEMENLNRTLTGIARVYEMQLKSASQQITTQDEINDQTKKLVQQIAELNAIYARMIEAMSVNMKQ